MGYGIVPNGVEATPKGALNGTLFREITLQDLGLRYEFLQNART